MEKSICLSSLSAGEQGIVERIETKGLIRRRLGDMGLCVGAKVQCVGKSPLGDPDAYFLRGSVIALRHSDAKNIYVIK